MWFAKSLMKRLAKVTHTKGLIPKQKPALRRLLSAGFCKKYGPRSEALYIASIRVWGRLCVFGQWEKQIVSPIKGESINQIKQGEGHIHDQRLPQPNPQGICEKGKRCE